MVSSSSEEKTRLAAKEARQTAPCEPIFPAELRRRQAPMLNLPGPLAAWHRSATACLSEAAAGTGFAVVAAVVCGLPLWYSVMQIQNDGNPAARQGDDLQAKCLRRFPSFGRGQHLPCQADPANPTKRHSFCYAVGPPRWRVF